MARSRMDRRRRTRQMSVVVYVVLTVAIFAVLGLVQRLIERM
jgi:cytochrome oxidase assembly protein ShyY1